MASTPTNGPKRTSSMGADLRPGDVVWVDLGTTVGREQSGRRPCVVVPGPDYLAVVDTLVMAVPLTKRNRAWPNHVLVHGDTGLGSPSWAITEQVQTISRERIRSTIGQVSELTLEAIRLWVADHLDVEIAAVH